MGKKDCRPEAPVEELHRLFDYCAETGVLRWKVSRGKAKAGDKAGCRNGRGYLQFSVNMRIHLAHRVIWRLHHQLDIPLGLMIDHINGVVNDNRFSNLRLATKSQNQANQQGCQRNNKSSGLRGVSWDKHSGKWQANVKQNGRQINLGRFATKEEASRVAALKRAELFRKFAGRA